MNPIFLKIGNFEIRYYALFILISVILSYFILIKEGKKLNINKGFLENLMFWTIIAGFIGARLYYVIFNYNYYSSNISEIIKVWNGGLAIHGGLIGGFLGLTIYCKKYKVNPFRMLDLAVVPMILSQAVGRWGNFFNQEAHGAATTLNNLKSMYIPEFVIKGMNIEGIYYIPTFYYESIWCFIGFIILLILRRYKYLKVGQLSCFYLMWYSFGRFFIEITRTDSLMFYGFKVAQIISILLFAGSLIAYIILSKKSQFEDLYNEPEGEIRF